MIAVVIVILTLLVLLCIRLQRDFISGLVFATGLLVCLPTALRIQLATGLPDLTVHRLVLICLLFFWLGQRARFGGPRGDVLIKWFLLWIGTHLMSTVFTQIAFGTSLKRFLDFVLEAFLFYYIASSSIRTRGEAFRVLRAAWVGLLVVSCVAFIEKYTGFNPVDRFIPDYSRLDTTLHDVNSTYPHRILLGTAMAMAWPLAFSLMSAAEDEPRVSRRWLWLSIVAFLSACYFAVSRGPWLAVVLGAVVLVVVGSKLLRRKILYIALLMGATLIVKPGVWATISDLAGSTVEDDSLKASSYKYRLELWKVAWAEVTKSPLRLALGYGPGAGSEKELDWEISWRGTERNIESWDNHYAYDLYQSGILGFASTLALYAASFWGLFRLWRSAESQAKDAMAGLLASVLILLFMMTNVLIYAKQLNFLFWVLVAAGGVIGRPFDVSNIGSVKASASGTQSGHGGGVAGAEWDDGLPDRSSENPVGHR